MNIAHLISKTEQKLQFLADLCDANTLYLCFCETFLYDGIGDIEIQISYFSITTCDRLSRTGDGVCISMKKSVNFTTCVNYSNCMGVNDTQTSHPIHIFFIMMYRPPSCTINEFTDVIIKINKFIFSLNSPGVNWSIPNLSSL